MADVAIKVDNVSKNFVLPHERVSSVKGLFTSLATRKSKNNETQHALKDISFEINRGEFFGIVGRNGSGKSTLLKILAGIYQPTSGRVQTNGKLVPFIELGVGFNPELSGRENIYLNGAMLGFSSKEIDAMYDDIVSFAELERFMDQKLKNYSSGMQVRLAFSMAIRAKAEILLIDEVLAVGDVDFQRKCFNYFKKLKKDKTTVVFVSHDMAAVREFCDRAVLINDSELVRIGDTDTVAKEYSQLFMDDIAEAVAEEKPEDNEDNRWGNGDVKIEGVNSKLVGNNVEVEYSIKAYKKTSKVIYGLHIIAADGAEVTAMNNVMINQPSPRDVIPGEKFNIKWEVLNIFSDGRYTINATLIDDLANTLDWRIGVSEFVVKRPERSTTAVLPPVKAEIIRKVKNA